MSTEVSEREELAADTVLEASDVGVSYGQVQALRDVDLRIGEGELVSLIGPNGAGKTTFVEAISGFLDYTGSITYRGEEVRDQARYELVSNGLIQCTEKRDLFGNMSVEENLELGAYRRARDTLKENLEFVYDLFPRLVERREQEARTMSGGEQQMLAIGRALMGDPAFLILDEPTLGLAPVILGDISAALDSIVEEGVTVLLTEQNVTFALKHANHISLLENGSVVRSGHPDDLRGDDYIRESYLGG